MKLLYITDTHIRGNSPANRLDNLPATLKTKLQEVVQFANDSGVDFVLHGGDFFDTPTPALSVAAEFIEVLKRLKPPVYGIFGNHDVFGGNGITLPRTVLGFVAKLGIINLVAEGEPVTLESRGIKATLTGQPYHIDLDRRERALDYMVEKQKDSDLSIHMVHGMLMDKKDFPGDCTMIEDITGTGADVTLAGHNHIGFGVVSKQGKHFINPGALVRLSNHRREIERKVEMALIDLSGGAVNCRLIPVLSARPGHEILDRTAMAERESRQVMLERFTAGVKEAAELQRWDVIQLIEELAVTENIDPTVRHEALRRIALAQESMQGKEGWD